MLTAILGCAATLEGPGKVVATLLLFGIIFLFAFAYMSYSAEELCAKGSKFIDRLFGSGFSAKVCAWEARDAEIKRENRMKKDAREKQERENFEKQAAQAVAELEVDLRVTEQKPIGDSPSCEGRVGLSA